MTDNLLYWADLETFGLLETHPIIEISLAVTDIELRIVDEESILVWGPDSDDALDAGREDDWAVKTHTESGLLDEAVREGLPPRMACDKAVNFLRKHGINKSDPLCGASVHADRTWLNRQMPYIIEAFGYRNIDVSSFKEMCRRLNPQMFTYMEDDVTKQIADAYGEGFKRHRGQWDLRWSIHEMRWYKDNFLFTDLGENREA